MENADGSVHHPEGAPLVSRGEGEILRAPLCRGQAENNPARGLRKIETS